MEKLKIKIQFMMYYHFIENTQGITYNINLQVK